MRETEASNNELSWNDISTAVLDQMHIDVDEVNWFSTYHVHHRVAEHFRRGRAFLLGDAAHIHSPVGGQGMNTGIGDAVNLAWKLAAVLRRRMHPALLDSYEPERIAFARRLVATTDRAFTSVTSRGAIARFVRLTVVPAVLPRLVAFAGSPPHDVPDRVPDRDQLSRQQPECGQAGDVHGGDRLPWVKDGAAGDNFAPLKSLDWQVHVYGERDVSIASALHQRRLAFHVFPWRPAIAATGLQPDAIYLIRPDGYVALADADGRADAVAAYFDARSRPGAALESDVHDLRVSIASVPDPKFVAKVPWRGARIARRDERAYGVYVSEEQRREAGCPAREFGDELRIRDTR